MWGLPHRRSRWGVSLQPGLVWVVELAPARRKGWSMGRQIALPVDSEHPWEDAGELSAVLESVRAIWDGEAHELALALDDRVFQDAVMVLPAWLHGEDLEQAVHQAWMERMQDGGGWALDYLPVADVSMSVSDEEQSYRVVALEQARVDRLSNVFVGLDLQLKRLQPQGMSLYHGVQMAYQAHAPDWLFSLMPQSLTAMGPNARGDWVTKTWDLTQPQTEHLSEYGAAVTRADGSPWWAGEVLESVVGFLEQETAEYVGAVWRWAVTGGEPAWQQAIRRSVTQLGSRLGHFSAVTELDSSDWPPGLDAWGVVWPEGEGDS